MANLASLPTELITEIFINLDYITLKTRLQVCRRFRDILKLAEDRRLRSILFRPDEETAESNDNDESTERNAVDGGSHDRGRGNYGDSNVSHQQWWGSRGTKARQYCYRLHPCLQFLKFKATGWGGIDTSDNEPVGFVCAATGAFTPFEATAVANENLLSDAIPADVFLQNCPSEGAEACQFICSRGGEKPKKLTVYQFVTALVEYSKRIDGETDLDAYFLDEDTPYVPTRDVLGYYAHDLETLGGDQYWYLDFQILNEVCKFATASDEWCQNAKVICTILRKFHGYRS